MRVCEPELTGSLKLDNAWVSLQLIHRPTGTKISCTKSQTLPNLRLPINCGPNADWVGERMDKRRIDSLEVETQRSAKPVRRRSAPRGHSVSLCGRINDVFLLGSLDSSRFIRVRYW